MENDKATENQTWNTALVIFVSRESLSVCKQTFDAACNALPVEGKVDFLVNGNCGLAKSLAEWILVISKLRSIPYVRIWSLSLGDKANAWNLYIHQIWRDEQLAFFIDGYVLLRSNALHSLQKCFLSGSNALGGSGVPTVGRSAGALRRKMTEQGGFYGNLCCIRGTVISELRERGIRIPLGLYRVDSLMGAMLYLGLDPKDDNWRISRVIVDGNASWDVVPKKWWRWSDIKAKRNQIERQWRGSMENAAVRFFFKYMKIRPEHLPRSCRELIDEWKRVDDVGYHKFARENPFSIFAYRRYIQQDFDWAKKDDVKLIVQVPKIINIKEGL